MFGRKHFILLFSIIYLAANISRRKRFIRMGSKHKFVVCVLAAANLLLDEDEEVPKKKRSIWIRSWVEKRDVEGCYYKLLPELRSTDSQQYRNFLRMSENNFDFLLDLVTPLIQKQDTTMRKSIPAGERLAITLHFLATGQSFKSLQFLFRVPQNTISTIIPEVLDAIYTVLKEDYLKVCVEYFLFIGNKKILVLF